MNEVDMARKMIQELDDGVENNDFEVSDWECDFLDNLRDHLETANHLSDAQYNKLEEIHRAKI